MVARSIFSLYDWNASRVDRTDISQSVVDIGIYFLFVIDLSPARSMWVPLEGKQALDHFESASPLLFRQIDLLNILISERRLRHRDLRNKGKPVREFDTGDIVVVSMQVKSTRKNGVSRKLVFKTKGPYRVLEKATPSSYFLRRLNFC